MHNSDKLADAYVMFDFVTCIWLQLFGQRGPNVVSNTWTVLVAAGAKNQGNNSKHFDRYYTRND